MWDLVSLQRTIGNQAVLQILSLHTRPIGPAGPPGRGTATVQRNEKSAELMKTLALPQVKEGPKVEVQDRIVAALEQQIELLIGPHGKLSHGHGTPPRRAIFPKLYRHPLQLHRN
jgi:hypothetical protein